MKIRVVSAVIAILILVPFIIVGGIPYAIMISLLGILSYKEILELKKSHEKYPLIIKILGLISLIYIIIGDYGINSLNYAVNYVKLVLPLVLILLPTVLCKKEKYNTKDAIYLLGSVYLLGFLFNLLIIIRALDIRLLLYLISITIFTDTFAYAIGCLIGKHKISSISPNKSWEGSIAGLIGGVSIALIIYANLIVPLSFKLVIVTIILSIVGQLGDLFYSKIKRENNLKDFSNIMPGHGGLLDRIDSLTFVVFTYVLLLWFL